MYSILNKVLVLVLIASTVTAQDHKKTKESTAKQRSDYFTSLFMEAEATSKLAKMRYRQDSAKAKPAKAPAVRRVAVKKAPVKSKKK